MVSILGDYSYSFPPKQELKLKLKDMLEDNVDKKYYLSDKQIQSLEISTRVDASNNTYLAIKNATKKGYLEATDGDGIDISSRMEHHRGNVQKGKAQTLTTQCDRGVVENDLRIRKLTPKECFRLMGVKDEDFEKVAKNQSNASLYHLAGDSLITTIMMALFSQMLDINWQEHFNNKEWWNNE